MDFCRTSGKRSGLLLVCFGQAAPLPAAGSRVSSCASNGAFEMSKWISLSIHSRSDRTVTASAFLSFRRAVVARCCGKQGGFHDSSSRTLTLSLRSLLFLHSSCFPVNGFEFAFQATRRGRRKTNALPKSGLALGRVRCQWRGLGVYRSKAETIDKRSARSEPRLSLGRAIKKRRRGSGGESNRSNSHVQFCLGVWLPGVGLARELGGFGGHLAVVLCICVDQRPIRTHHPHTAAPSPVSITRR